jgi:hypothetical protein
MELLRNEKGLRQFIPGIFILLLVLTHLSAAATNYYVDPSSPSTANLGTFNAPWISIDAIPVTINFFLPGDTVFFKRGQYFSGTLSINSSGSITAPIVFMPYGSGYPPVFQYNLTNPAESSSVNRMIIRLNQVNNVVIDGFELTDYSIPEFDHSVTANVGYGVYIYKGQGDNGNNNVIKNVTISRVGAGIAIDGGSHNTLTGCTIKNLRMVINTPNTSWDDYGAVGIMLAGSDNTITKNQIKDCWGNSFDYQFDGGGIEMYGPSSNNRILYNTAIGNLGWMEFGSPTGGDAVNNLVAYNLLINNGNVCWINTGNGFTVNVQGLQLFNNNIIETTKPRLPDVTSLIGIFTRPSLSNVINMKNNIFWVTTSVNITDPVTQPFNGPQLVHQNNLYHLNGGSPGFVLDASEKDLSPAASLFTDAASSADPVSWNFNLRQPSAAIDQGQNTGIDKDFFGKPVPAGNAPDIGIAEDVLNVLPLQILSCTGWAGTNGNNVEWVTTNDAADHFEIEKSDGGTTFNTIASIPHKTNAGTGTIQYQYIDDKPTNEIQYYRIKAIEPGGNILYSRIISIKNNSSSHISVSPNPASETLTVTIAGDDFRGNEIVLFNMAGKEVGRERTNGMPYRINVGALPKGVYVIKITDQKTGKFYNTLFTK